MSDKLLHVLQVTVMIAGGIVLILKGQPEVGAGMIGAAIGNSTPQSIGSILKRAPKLPQ